MPTIAESVSVPDTKRTAYFVAKRAFDICFSAGAIAVLAVPSAVLCVVIVVDSPGAPIYAQERVTKGGKHFRMYKFRSMVKDADAMLKELQDRNEADGPMFKIKDDPRITRVGRFIRKHSIDEFPQFVNVLMGDMSVVGPRPGLPSEVARYSERDMGRLAVRAGCTGLWQVEGRSDMGFSEMVDLDLRYVREMSFSLDLKCIARTVGSVIMGSRGAY